MGALGYFLKISSEQERKLLEKIQKFADFADPDKIESDLKGYATKLDNTYNTALINNEIINIIALYLKEENEERWKKCTAIVKERIRKEREESDKVKKIWKTSEVV